MFWLLENIRGDLEFVWRCKKEVMEILVKLRVILKNVYDINKGYRVERF